MQDDKTAVFELHRRSLEGLAYRMLGSLAEAQDIVQETYLKWHQSSTELLENPRAWLMTVCGRISINHLKSARVQRELYVGEWLPEPFSDDMDSEDPETIVELEDTISMALLLALEKLTPVERAVFLLHDVFELSYNEISESIDKNVANCRKSGERARQKIQGSRQRFKASHEEHQSLLKGFLAAANQLDVNKLISLLSADVQLYSDGGGKVEALPKMLEGSEKVARFFIGIFKRFDQRSIKVEIKRQWFNGSFGVLLFEDQRLATALTIEINSGKIDKIFAVRTPDKLEGFKVNCSDSDLF